MKKLVLLIVLMFLFFSFSALCQVADHIVISEIMAGGGNSGGSPYSYDYITLYNPTASSVSVSSWSIQYTSSAPPYSKVNLTGSIPANSYYLIELAPGGTTTNEFFCYPDVIDNTLSLAKGSGKVALVSNQTALASDPTLPDANIIDFVGYASDDNQSLVTVYEGSRWPYALGDRKGIRRKTDINTSVYNYGTDGSGWDTDDNSSDFYEWTNLEMIPNQPYSSTSPLANHVVIAEVFAGGGTGTSGTYQCDYVVLYNSSAVTQDISTWSLQYYNGSAWIIENLTGSIAPGAYFLIQLAGGGSGDPLPTTPDLTGTTDLDATNGEVALVRNTTTLSTTDPLTGNIQSRVIEDFIGYGSVSDYEGVTGPAPSPGSTSSIRRKDNSGANTYFTNGSGWDGNDNSANFYSQSSPVPMPVELTSFSASVIENGIELRWKTETEVNNYGFDIQRSTDKNKWDKVGFVNGHGNSNSPKEYSFTDKSIVSGEYSYRLKQIDNDGQYEFSGIVEINLNKPLGFKLNQNYPNPFNPVTSISFQIPVKSNVTLKVYNIVGKEVATLMDGEVEPGSYVRNFDGNDLASGVYFFKLQTNSFSEIKKMLLLK